MAFWSDVRDYWSTRRAGPQLMLDAAALAITIDGHEEAEELNAACSLLGDLPWFHEVTPEELRQKLEKTLTRTRAQSPDPRKEARRFARTLHNPDGRDLLLGICAYIISVGPNSPSPEEQSWIQDLAHALDISDERLQELQTDIQTQLNELPTKK